MVLIWSVYFFYIKISNICIKYKKNKNKNKKLFRVKLFLTNHINKYNKKVY